MKKFLKNAIYFELSLIYRNIIILITNVIIWDKLMVKCHTDTGEIVYSTEFDRSDH